MTARDISCTSQRDHDEANEIVQHNKRSMGIPFLTPMNNRILNWASPITSISGGVTKLFLRHEIMASLRSKLQIS